MVGLIADNNWWNRSRRENSLNTEKREREIEREGNNNKKEKDPARSSAVTDTTPLLRVYRPCSL